MKTVLKSLSLAAAFALAIQAIPANANGLGGASMKATNGVDDTCSVYAYGWIANSCTTTKSFIVALPFSGAAGYRTFSVMAQGAATGDVSCRIAATTNAQNGFYSGSWVSLPAAGSPQTIDLGTLFTDTKSSLYLLCNLAQNAKVFSIQWDN
ncbi:hypothetical protein JY651_20090 [Pyxidicoccus parkwayensis]|uniref:Uncharacterized protein n=1 Tax=Pyxidicoccus parkwayensis TaxID=2813578 RepID=A0ABX7P9D0_9BACT|nr:hypothetical protein [Pyxidicoccus parkwaysis]QSQ27071.1 hypothetical protein JY651_20090 [Pyxidicoccus parkwaysis]